MRRMPLEVDELLGAVNCGASVRFFGTYLADWILDYAEYQPDYAVSDGEPPLRGGLVVVRPNQCDEFCASLREYEVGRVQLEKYLTVHASNTPLCFYIDFQKALYVNGFHEISVEDYVPSQWNGIEDDPLDYVPDDVRKMWECRSGSAR